MTDTAYCYFETQYQAEQFRARLASSFEASTPYVTETPYQSRSVVVEVRERDGSQMGTRTFQTLLTNVNLYDGLISDDGGEPATTRPGGAPFSGDLPRGVVDDTNS